MLSLRLIDLAERGALDHAYLLLLAAPSLSLGVVGLVFGSHHLQLWAIVLLLVWEVRVSATKRASPPGGN